MLLGGAIWLKPESGWLRDACERNLADLSSLAGGSGRLPWSETDQATSKTA